MFRCRSPPINHGRQLPALLIIVTLQIIVLLAIQASAYRNARQPYYNSEDQETLNNVRNLAPAIRWNDDQLDEDGLGARNNAAQRRSSDNDLEDGLEEEDDEDRDEFKSGSTNHDSYENPSFGESNRAARDGEDIESFFDKHLGPQEAMESSEPDNEVPINEVPILMGGAAHRRLAPGEDPDDHYEAAASSPLSSIFHSILNAHKRPLVITTSDDSSDGTTVGQQQSTSSSAPVGSSIRGGGGYLEQATPIAYFTPIATGAPGSGYEQQAGGATGLAQASTETNGPAEVGGQSQEEYGPVREIYISRRPSILSGASQIQYNQHQGGYSTGGPRLIQQSSNAHWRGAHSMASQRPYPAAGDDGQLDYGRYPVAASYAYQREQAQPEDEQTTVSYGLSFGASPGEANEEQSADAGPDDQSSVDEPAYAPHQSRNLMRQVAPTRAYSNNYNYPQTGLMMQAVGNQGGYAPRQMQAIQQQAPYHGARYHKDPSESMVQPIANYGQYSGASSNLARDSRWATRQQLLAKLDKEIKSNPYYRQQQEATAPAVQYTAQQSGRRSAAVKPDRAPKSSSADGDIDTYSSFHSEIDPYKSFTSSARIISEPVPNKQQPQRVGGLSIGTEQQQRSGSQSQASRQQQATDLLTGPLINMDSQRQLAKHLVEAADSPTSGKSAEREQVVNLRVRRENSDDHDDNDPDDDGVWVDDDEDDDSRQHSSSDVSETSQKPEEDEGGSQQEADSLNRASGSNSPPGVIGSPHGYELSPDDLMVYPG